MVYICRDVLALTLPAGSGAKPGRRTGHKASAVPLATNVLGYTVSHICKENTITHFTIM